MPRIKKHTLTQSQQQKNGTHRSSHDLQENRKVFITSCARGNDSSSVTFQMKKKIWLLISRFETADLLLSETHQHKYSVLFKASTLFKPVSVRVLCSSLKSSSYQHVRCLKCASELSYKQNRVCFTVCRQELIYV